MVKSLVFSVASGQVLIASPPWLRDQFTSDGLGEITASTATFGAPTFGERIYGTLKYAKPLYREHPHCKRSGYTDVDAFEQSMSGECQDESSCAEETEDSVAKPNYVVVVRRGGCSFVTKVRVAQKLGARAVIFVDDPTAGWTSQSIKNLLVIANEYGDSVQIPSVIIPNKEGEALIAGIEKAEQENTDASLELHWDVPSNNIVRMDMWMSPARSDVIKFLKAFQSVAEALRFNMQFVPHYDIRYMGTFYNEECLDDNKKHCATDPDRGGPIKGSELVAESLRELCAWKTTAESFVPSKISDMALPVGVDAPKGLPQTKDEVVRSFKYWDYMSLLHERCPLGEEEADKRFGSKVCSEKLMVEVGIDVDAVNKCIKEEGDSILDIEMAHGSELSFQLRINDWMYRGDIERDVVANAVCAGFMKKPEACLTGFKPSFVFSRDMIILLAVMGIAAIACVYALLKCLANRARLAVKDEVLFEVKQQMAKYSRLQSLESDDEIEE